MDDYCIRYRKWSHAKCRKCHNEVVQPSSTRSRSWISQHKTNWRCLKHMGKHPWENPMKIFHWYPEVSPTVITNWSCSLQMPGVVSTSSRHIHGSMVNSPASTLQCSTAFLEVIETRLVISSLPWTFEETYYPLVNLQKTMENHHVKW